MVSLGWAGLDPAPMRDENSLLGVSIPSTTLGQVSAHPNEAMNSIKVLQQTAAAARNFEAAWWRPSAVILSKARLCPPKTILTETPKPSGAPSGTSSHDAAPSASRTLTRYPTARPARYPYLF